MVSGMILECLKTLKSNKGWFAQYREVLVGEPRPKGVLFGCWKSVECKKSCFKRLLKWKIWKRVSPKIYSVSPFLFGVRSRGKISTKQFHSTSGIRSPLTCFTFTSGVASWTWASEVIYSIATCSSISARIWRAVIDIWADINGKYQI